MSQIYESLCVKGSICISDVRPWLRAVTLSEERRILILAKSERPRDWKFSKDATQPPVRIPIFRYNFALTLAGLVLFSARGPRQTANRKQRQERERVCVRGQATLGLFAKE